MTAPSAARQASYALVSTVLALALCEGGVRIADGGALPQLDCYEQHGERPFTLGSCARTLLRPGGGTWTLTTDAQGRRPTAGHAKGSPWLVLGDSQVLGMYLDDPDTLAARLDDAGVPVLAQGTPAHGVEDAVAALDLAALPPLAGVLVVVNGANDWAEAGHPVGERCRVVHGWLVPAPRADTLPARFFATPLTASHLLTWAVSLGARDPSVDPGEQRWAESPYAMAPSARTAAATRIASAIAGLAAAHPELRVRSLVLPVDFATSAARASEVLPAARQATHPWTDPTPWREVAALLAPVPVLDASPVLGDAQDFQDGDFHLSPTGAANVAAALQDGLR